jgi:hypothetical protein
MQHVSCTEFVVIGQLLHKELEDNKKIHRNILAATIKGRITIYWYNETFILECDTDGDHNPNDYYFFKTAEEQAIFETLSKLGELIGTTDQKQIKSLVEGTLSFLKSY